MKRDGILMLIAGIVFGAVAGFIVTRQYYVDKMDAAPPAAQAAAQPPQGQQQAQQDKDFNPKQHEAMLEQIKAELAKDPKNVEKRVMLGNIYFDAQKWSEAIPWYEEAVKLAPNNTDVLVDLGVCYRNSGRPDEALSMFKKALKLDPNKKQAMYNEVVVYAFDKKDPVQARALMAKLQKAYPDDAMVKKLSEAISQ